MINNKKGSFLSDPELLEKIDKLRDLNISQHLVVVGDQSSGKSSLLESLTGIPFPKDQTLCTRHATQITCCRGKDDYVDIRIIAGPHPTDQHKQDVEAFHVPTSSRSEIQNDFAGILRRANDKMGLRADIADGNGAVFSEDVLKIEIHGPDEDYLTIIDVPGIFRATTQGTTKEDMVMVKELVKRYIKNDRTVILAVLPSNVDVATQEILELAEDYDKDGVRTLGVLTKPDLVTEPEAQAAVCDLINGKKRPLNLGYFLVRNRGPKSALDDQSKLDRMFHAPPWADLPQDRVGIPALKEELRRLLFQVAEREYPKLLQDVNSKIRKYKTELDNLGLPRQDERQQRSFLSHIAGAFQDRVRAALAADYNAGPVFNQVELRLITQVVNITHLFNEEFQLKAHSRHFHTPDLLKSEGEFPNPDYESEPTPKRFTLTGVDDFTPEEIAEIGHIVVRVYDISPPSEDVMTWIKNIYSQTRGLDLGTFNPNLIAMAFSEQSRKWGSMTKLYMNRVIITLHRFITSALRSVCQEDHVRLRIWTSIQKDLHERYKRAMEQANLLIEVERHKKPYTLNHQFSEALSKSRGRRITELLQPKARKDTTQYGETQYMVNLADIAKAAEGKSNVEQLQEEIHDILHAYYRLALVRFVDNVFQLAVDYNLLHGPHSPLRVFTQEWVINLESGELGKIAGEAKSTKRHRSKLTKKIEDLSGAVKILSD
ncbi:related to RBTMx2 protein [Fusarium torulosum]|uniref:Related to RBTMx2 protein n=1 Tax=Fusarium torulosum TaxID=33205 RepID=A0AAE8MCN9_9HYPO|nr:related to RBTMx2 protein [Fusarium torulosum]